MPPTFAARLTERLGGEFVYGVPNIVEIQVESNPASCSKIGRHQETLRVVSDQSTLLAEARLTAESDVPVAMMVQKVVSKFLLANAEGDVLFTNSLKA